MYVGNLISFNNFWKFDSKHRQFKCCGNKRKKIEIFNVINLTTFWLYAVCSICIFCAANPFIEVWIGTDYLLNYRELFIVVLNVYIGGMLFCSI